MRRLYFLIPSIKLTKTIVNELKQLGVPRKHLHTVASMNQSLKSLPKASIWQKTELAHGLEWGTGIGALAGLSGGLLTIVFPPGGISPGASALLIGAAAGALVGATTMGMVKSNEHNHQLDDYKEDIESGKILLMVDVPKPKVEKINESILSQHPEADIKVS